MYLRVITVLLICSSNIVAIGYFEVHLIRKGQYLSFPIIRRAPDKRVKTKINQLLQLSELRSLVRPSAKNIFEQVSANDGSIYGGKKGMISTVYSNNRRILSIGFDQSSCGMTCGYWHRYYTFNSANGDRIELSDLFTPEGFEKFQKKVIAKRSRKYRREVRTKVEPEFQEAFFGTIGCFEYDDLSDFYIQNKSIVIDGENCLHKSQKFEGLNMVEHFRLAEFRSFLNQYGRIVFGLSHESGRNFRSTKLPQLFEGFVDDSLPIAMLFDREFDSGIRGVYAYLRYGEGISLKGTELEGKTKVTEYIRAPQTTMKVYGPTREYVENGFISGILTTGRFEGMWTNKEGSQHLKLSASVK